MGTPEHGSGFVEKSRPRILVGCDYGNCGEAAGTLQKNEMYQIMPDKTSTQCSKHWPTHQGFNHSFHC